MAGRRCNWSSIHRVSTFIELVTSSDYRALLDARRDALKRDAVLSATPALDFDLQGTEAQAVRFLIGAHDDSIDAYDTKWLAEDEQIARASRGQADLARPIESVGDRRRSNASAKC